MRQFVVLWTTLLVLGCEEAPMRTYDLDAMTDTQTVEVEPDSAVDAGAPGPWPGWCTEIVDNMMTFKNVQGFDERNLVVYKEQWIRRNGWLQLRYLNYEYNEDEQLTRVERIHVSGGVEFYESIIVLTYENGLLVRATADKRGNGEIDTVRRFFYDELDREVRAELDEHNDGVLDAIGTYAWDNTLLVQANLDEDADGIVDFRKSFAYNNGRLVREDQNDGVDDSVELRKILHWTGNQLDQIDYDNGADGNVDRSLYYTYRDGNLVLILNTQSRLGGEAVLSEHILTYDEAGNLLSHEVDHFADGSINASARYTYDCWE